MSNLLADHSYVEQSSSTLNGQSWTNGFAFTPTSPTGGSNILFTVTNGIGAASHLFWRIYAP